MTKKLSLTSKMLMSLALGIVVAFVLQALPASFIRDDVIINGVLWFVGTLFLNAIKMIVVPLIFVSLIVGVTNVTNPQKLGRMGGKVMLWYILTTPIAVGFAMLFGTLFNPAKNININNVHLTQATINTPPPIQNILVDIVPVNPFQALVAGNSLQIIFIAIVLGLAMVALGEKSRVIKEAMVSLNDIIMKITGWVMLFAPYGVFALIARSFSTLGLDAIVALIAFVALVWFILLFHIVVVYGGALKILMGKDPVTGKRIKLSILFKKALPAVTFGFASSSSAATLPITMECADNLGLKREFTSMSLPLGVTFNMDGTAIMQGVATIFLASIYNVDIGISGILTVLLTATLATVGTAGVPGSGMIMLSIVLHSVGLPMEAIAIIFGIDRLLDMPRTVVNVFGDFVCGLVVAKQENMLDYEQYNRVQKVATA